MATRCLRFRFLCLLSILSVTWYNLSAMQAELHDYARKGDTDTLKGLVQRGYDINALNPKGETALHIASKIGHLAAVTFLVERGAKIELLNNKSQDAEFLARDNGHHAIAQFLASQKAHLNSSKISQSSRSLNTPDSEGKTPLHRAVESGNKKEVQQLLSQGADPNVRNANGGNALHIASYHGHKKICQMLIDQGCDKNATNVYKNTPLHVAAIQGHEEVVRCLLKAGVVVDGRNKNNHTPQEAAHISKHLDIAQIISQSIESKKKNTEQDRPARDQSGSFSYAQKSQGRGNVSGQSDSSHKNDRKSPQKNDVPQHKAPRHFLEEGNNELHDACLAGDLEKVKALLPKINCNSVNKRQMPPLFFAAHGQHLACVVTLLEKGASYGMIDEFGLTPAHYATLKARDADGPVLSFFIQKGYLTLKPGESRDQLYNRLRREIPFERLFPDVQWLPQEEISVGITSDSSGLYLIHYGALEGDIVKIKQFLNSGGSVHAAITAAKPDDIRLDRNFTALHLAAIMGHAEIVKFLIEKGAHINAKGAESGHTPLHSACFYKNLEIAELLIANKADVNCMTKANYFPVINSVKLTPLLWAAECDLEDLASALLDAQADPLAKNDEGWNALHIAAKKGSVAIVTLLYKHRLSLDSRTTDGKTALHIAAEWGKEDVAKFLLDKKASLLEATDSSSNNFTALHWAAFRRNSNVVRLLVSRGANTRAKDSLKRTPRDFGGDEIKALLK